MSFRLSGRKRTRRQAGFRPGPPPKRVVVVRSRGQPRALTFVPRSMGPKAETEIKYFDEERALTAIATGTTGWAGGEADPATVNALFAPTTGNDINNRIGRKVDVRNIRIKGIINCAAQADQTGADSSLTCRIVLVQDKQTNAAQLNAEDVFDSGDATQAVYMFRNLAFLNRFKILKDKSFTFQNPNMTFDGTNIEQAGLRKYFKINFKFRKPLRVTFNSTNGGTVADIIDNSFHIIAITDSASLAPNLSYKVRTAFIDP